jgi:hypothetical protein
MTIRGTHKKIHQEPISKAKMKKVLKSNSNHVLPRNEKGYVDSYIPYLLTLYVIDCVSTKQLSTLLQANPDTVKKYLSTMKSLGYVADIRNGNSGSYWHILPAGIVVLEDKYMNLRKTHQRTFMVSKGTYKVDVDAIKPKHSILHDARMTNMIMRLYELSKEGDFQLSKWYGPIVTKWMYPSKQITSAYTEYGTPEEYLISRYWADAYSEIVIDDKILQIHWEMDSSNQNYLVLADQKIREVMKFRRENPKFYRPAGIMAFVIENDTDESVRADKIARLMNEHFIDYSDKVNRIRKVLFANIDHIMPIIATRLDMFNKYNPVLDKIWSFSHDPNELYSLYEVSIFMNVDYVDDGIPMIINDKWRDAIKGNDLEQVWWGREMGYPIKNGTLSESRNDIVDEDLSLNEDLEGNHAADETP